MKGSVSRISYILFVFISIWFNIHLCSSQEYDLGFWSEGGIVKKVNRWQFSSLFELRTREFSQQTDRLALILSPRYKITDWLCAGVAYMPMRKWEEDYTEWRHRHYYFLQGSLDYRSLSFSLRERFQYTHKPGSTEDNSWVLEKVWRNQVKVSKDISNKPLALSAWIETFVPFNKNIQIKETRYATSCTYYFKEKYAVEWYFMLYDKVIDDTFYFGFNYYFFL